MPRPRFSLRTLLVVVTIFCCFLGWLDWKRRIVAERWASFYSIGKDGQTIVNWNIVDEDQSMSFPRELMGDMRFKSIQVRHDSEEGAIERIRQAFPEAKVYMDEPWEAQPATQ
jgi:hypothetical protein